MDNIVYTRQKKNALYYNASYFCCFNKLNNQQINIHESNILPGVRGPFTWVDSAIPISDIPKRSIKRWPVSSSIRWKIGIGREADPEQNNLEEVE